MQFKNQIVLSNSKFLNCFCSVPLKNTPLHETLIASLKNLKNEELTPLESLTLNFWDSGDDVCVIAPQEFKKDYLMTLLTYNHMLKCRNNSGATMLILTNDCAGVERMHEYMIKLAGSNPMNLCALKRNQGLSEITKAASSGFEVIIASLVSISMQLDKSEDSFRMFDTILYLNEGSVYSDTRNFASDMSRCLERFAVDKVRLAFISELDLSVMEEFFSLSEKAASLIHIQEEKIDVTDIRQYAFVNCGQTNRAVVTDVLCRVTFKQAVIFVNDVETCNAIYTEVQRCGFRAEYLLATLTAERRAEILTRFTNYRCRVLIAMGPMGSVLSTNDVNLVMNIDSPSDRSLYAKRIQWCNLQPEVGSVVTLFRSDEARNAFAGIAKRGNFGVKVVDCDQDFSPNLHDLEFYNSCMDLETFMAKANIPESKAKKPSETNNNFEPAYSGSALVSPIDLVYKPAKEQKRNGIVAESVESDSSSEPVKYSSSDLKSIYGRQNEDNWKSKQINWDKDAVNTGLVKELSKTNQSSDGNLASYKSPEARSMMQPQTQGMADDHLWDNFTDMAYADQLKMLGVVGSNKTTTQNTTRAPRFTKPAPRLPYDDF